MKRLGNHRSINREDDIYCRECAERFLDDDEISPSEEGFMVGYMEA